MNPVILISSAVSTLPAFLLSFLAVYFVSVFILCLADYFEGKLSAETLKRNLVLGFLMAPALLQIYCVLSPEFPFPPEARHPFLYLALMTGFLVIILVIVLREAEK